MALEQKLVDAVEQAILDLVDYNLQLRVTPATVSGIAIQPLRNWKDQGLVLTFKDMLRNQFEKVLKDGI